MTRLRTTRTGNEPYRAPMPLQLHEQLEVLDAEVPREEDEGLMSWLVRQREHAESIGYNEARALLDRKILQYAPFLAFGSVPRSPMPLQLHKQLEVLDAEVPREEDEGLMSWLVRQREHAESIGYNEARALLDRKILQYAPFLAFGSVPR